MDGRHAGAHQRVRRRDRRSPVDSRRCRTRAARETPFGTTIAHGFLTLSLISTLLQDVVTVGGVRMAINYGLNRVRFVSPVPAGSRIRARVVAGSAHRRRRRRAGDVERDRRTRGRRKAVPGRGMAGALLPVMPRFEGHAALRAAGSRLRRCRCSAVRARGANLQPSLHRTCERYSSRSRYRTARLGRARSVAARASA